MMSKMSDTFVNLPDSKMDGIPNTRLHSGALFTGVQSSRFEGNLDVKIDLLKVDLDIDYLCGYITVIDLNYDSDYLQRTYFNGEIISKRYPFGTRKWHADSETDKKHWWRFGCFYRYLPAFSVQGDLYDYNQLKGEDCVYMRWKEERGIGSEHGIVGPGFHYVCFNKTNGILESFYYERYRSQWCEIAMHAKYAPQKSMPVYEFR